MACGRLFALAPTLAVFACSAVPERAAERHRAADDAQAAAADAGARTADVVEVVAGVPNRGRDPAVIAVDIAGEGMCTGTLVSPRLVLTARHCVSKTVTSLACPPSGVQVLADRPARDLGILAGEDVVSARRVASGIAVIAPSGVTLCDADIAVIILDKPVVTAKPLPLASRGPAAGDRVRAVGFGRPGDGDPAGKKLLREHVRVLSVTAAEFTVGEATCQGDSGGPAIDEDTGEILGVVSRGGPSCEGSGVHNIYTRVDTYSWLMEEAFARIAEITVEEKQDAGSNAAMKAAARGTKHKPPTDVGGGCETASDCAAGICINESMAADESRSYCSRPCGSGDRCPTNFHCMAVSGLEGSSACVDVR